TGLPAHAEGTGCLTPGGADVPRARLRRPAPAAAVCEGERLDGISWPAIDRAAGCAQLPHWRASGHQRDSTAAWLDVTMPRNGDQYRARHLLRPLRHVRVGHLSRLDHPLRSTGGG